MTQRAAILLTAGLGGEGDEAGIVTADVVSHRLREGCPAVLTDEDAQRRGAAVLGRVPTARREVVGQPQRRPTLPTQPAGPSSAGHLVWKLAGRHCHRPDSWMGRAAQVTGRWKAVRPNVGPVRHPYAGKEGGVMGRDQ
jgi:hypothetical protein